MKTDIKLTLPLDFANFTKNTVLIISHTIKHNINYKLKKKLTYKQRKFQNEAIQKTKNKKLKCVTKIILFFHYVSTNLINSG